MQAIWQIWQDPQLRMLFVFNIITFGLIFFALIIMLAVNLARNKAVKFEKYMGRLKKYGTPEEITGCFEEICEQLKMMERSNLENIQTYFDLVQELEKKIEHLRSMDGLMVKKIRAVLQSFIAKLRMSNTKQFEESQEKLFARLRKVEDNLFAKLSRLEQEDMKSLISRMEEFEAYVDSCQMFDELEEVEDLQVNGMNNGNQI